ncbi:MAG TPA: hypothetical protein VFP39_06680 [Gemmatimonadales bacterium]|nr:hypothetical protein [Gemmatimonadales bacterium]
MATQLAFTVQPGDAAAGDAIGPVVTVVLKDRSGQTVTSAENTVTVALQANPGGGTLSGTLSVAAVQGVATFPDLHVDKASAGYTLTARATKLTSATSTPFAIKAGPAAQLVFLVQPANTMGGVVITPPVQVAAQDAFANLAAAFQDSVRVALGGNPAPGTLSGTTTVKAVGGIATFSDLTITQPSLGYTLTAVAAGLTGAGSAPFGVTKPTASLHITTATGGDLLDPDGYAGCVDPASDGQGGTTCAVEKPVGVNGAVTVTVDTGAHTLLLTGVAANCAVSGDNPRAVHAAPGGTVEGAFSIICTQPSFHVTTATTGASIDANGYSVCVDITYYGCSATATIGANGAVTMPVAPGSHDVELYDVADNCTAAGGGSRTVDVAGPTEVSFAITCAAAGNLRITATTTGMDLPSGYSVCFDNSGTSCYRYGWVPANVTTIVPSVLVGLHSVTLLGLPANCAITVPATRTVTVPQDGTVDAAFAVACTEAQRIAFSYFGTILVSRVDIVEPRVFTSGAAPAWSPDGHRMAYECNQDLCAINADSTGFMQLTADAAGNHHPTWSPDGSKIAFAATHAGVTDLYVMTASGSAAARITQGVGFAGSPAWSPDGTKIVFDCQVDAGNDDLCAVNADGSGFVRLTNDPASDSGAAWKPDGSTLAFATARYGAAEVALLDVSSGSVSRIGAGLPGFAPAWSPDGSQLAVVQVEENCDYDCFNYDEIVLVSVDGGTRHVLSPGDQPAWKPHP